jgi:hypothetical protein
LFFETDFEGKYQNLLRYVQQHYPKDMPWFRAQVTALSWGTTVRALKEYLDALRKHTFMLSTSAPLAGFHPKDNLYMWGHYGNGHRGIAIEFDTEKVAAAVLKHHEIENGAALTDRAIWSKVEYAKTFAPIAAADVFAFLKQEKDLELRRIKARVKTTLEIYYKRMSVIKSSVWSSENEWRLMWRNASAPPSVYKCPISDECIRNIFIGLNFTSGASACASEAKHQFPTAGVFQAIKRHGDLALEFEPC